MGSRRDLRAVLWFVALTFGLTWLLWATLWLPGAAENRFLVPIRYYLWAWLRPVAGTIASQSYGPLESLPPLRRAHRLPSLTRQDAKAQREPQRELSAASFAFGWVKIPYPSPGKTILCLLLCQISCSVFAS
jgi:hypothetical protein